MAAGGASAVFDGVPAAADRKFDGLRRQSGQLDLGLARVGDDAFGEKLHGRAQPRQLARFFGVPRHAPDALLEGFRNIGDIGAMPTGIPSVSKVRIRGEKPRADR